MNRATRFIVATLGVILGLTGIDHGFFEILQGNQPTTGLIIQAIGPAQKMWFYGGEEAFTIIPNFLATGISAIIVSVAIIIWSVGFVHRKYGVAGLSLLVVLLFLVGGGIAAPIVFGPPTLATATRIHKPLTWWRKRLPDGAKHVLANLWPVFLSVGTVSLFIGLYIAITGHVPGVSSNDPERILNICWTFIFGGGLGMFLLSFVAGFSYDIQQQPEIGASAYG
jgi:hypothetical protein